MGAAGQPGGVTDQNRENRPLDILEKGGERPMLASYTAYVEWDPAARLYVGTVPGLPGAHTQADTLDELRVNLLEVVTLCLEAYEGDAGDLPRFVGLQQIEIAG